MNNSKKQDLEYFLENEFNSILEDITINTIMILPQIQIYMKAGYNFHNARERVLYLKRRKERINCQNSHPEPLQ